MMFRLSIVSLLMLAGIGSAMGQDYKRLRVGLGGGLVLPKGNIGTPGWSASIEPGFRLTNNFLVGLKGETAVFTRAMSGRLTVANSPSQLFSGTVFTQLYFSPNYFRPFVAGGVGYCLLSDDELIVTFNGSTETLMIGKDQVHYFVRAGVEVWHLSVSAEFALMSDEKLTDYLELQSSYFSFRLMLFIGGGFR
jgi:hypothetical protein